VSTGRKQSPTPEGSFNLTWRSRQRHSTDNEDWLLEWYFNFVNARGVSFHLFDLPGYPASHACVRLLLRDAKWIYEWGEPWTLDDHRKMKTAGTPVVILGSYPFDQPPAWLVVSPPPVALPRFQSEKGGSETYAHFPPSVSPKSVKPSGDQPPEPNLHPPQRQALRLMRYSAIFRAIVLRWTPSRSAASPRLPWVRCRARLIESFSSSRRTSS
jgi:hypothetical protein